MSERRVHSVRITTRTVEVAINAKLIAVFCQLVRERSTAPAAVAMRATTPITASGYNRARP
jgi:hypothetical protein